MNDGKCIHKQQLGVCIPSAEALGGTPSRTNIPYWGGDIPWVTPSEITKLHSKYLHNTTENITATGLAGSAARLLPAMSVVVTTRATLGEAAITTTPLATNQGFKNIVPNATSNPLFTYYRIKTLKREMERLASGTTFLEISKSDFERIELVRPQKEEQERIATLLDCVDSIIERAEVELGKLKSIKAALTQDLLSGSVRIPDDLELL